MDLRLAAILAAMTSCAKPGPVPGRTFTAVLPDEPVTTDLPDALQFQDGAGTVVPLGPPGSEAWTRLEALCWSADTPCGPETLRFPVEAILRERAHVPAEFRAQWMLVVAETLVTEVRFTADDGLETRTFRADPWTGQWDGALGSGLIIPGRPVGPAHRAACPDASGCAADWVRLAADEDEAVEAFRVHVDELVSLGAPDALVQRAREAMADEVRHRDLALAEATARAGRPLVLGKRPAPARPQTGPMAILRSVARDGALNESLSLALLLAQAEVAPPDQRAVLEGIAADEVRHAALAWDTLHWAWPTLTDPERDALRAALRTLLTLRSPLGRLDGAQLREVCRTARAAVVEPLIRGLA